MIASIIPSYNINSRSIAVFIKSRTSSFKSVIIRDSDSIAKMGSCKWPWQNDYEEIMQHKDESDQETVSQDRGYHHKRAAV